MIVADEGPRRWCAWLFDPHSPMPTLELSRREIDDLVACIESLCAE